MYANEILAIHQAHPARLPDVLGDGVLMERNPIYRKVMDRARDLGCEFQEAWTTYLLLPFHQLSHIVATKKIPYVPSAKLLGDIEAKRPGAFEVEALALPESYHLHEATHVIADACFEGFHGEGQERILRLLLCESFANTVDALACVNVDDPMHGFFLKLNCYMHPVKKNMATLKRLIEKHGVRTTAELTMIAYLHANFLRDGTADTDDAKALAQMTEKLDPQFRVQTTETHLKLEGFDGEIFEILDFPFMQVFKANPRFAKAMDAMTAVLA